VTASFPAGWKYLLRNSSRYFPV